VKRAHELRALGLKPADIAKMIGVSRATVYRYLSMGSDELA
jgi:predicted transcriptional regulator